MMITGVPGSACLIPARRSSPSPPFMRRSVTTTSVGSAVKAASAFAPSCATRVWNPTAARSLAMVCAMSGTSSTISAVNLDISALLLNELRGTVGARRPQHGDGRPLADGALDVDLTGVIADDAGGDGQPQSRAFAAWLRREERLEDGRQVFGRDARPLVGDGDPDHVARRGTRRQTHALPRRRGVARVQQ